jgi:hypothetical protein
MDTSKFFLEPLHLPRTTYKTIAKKDVWKNDTSKITSKEHHNSRTSWKNLAALNIPQNQKIK